MALHPLTRLVDRFCAKPLPVVIMNAVEHDPKQPSPTIAALAELMERFPRLQVRLLQDVLGESLILQLTQRGSI